jgi:hypothetical protein
MIVGIIGDIHEPFGHPMYSRFCQDTFGKWRVDEVVFIGDIADGHGLSFWDHDPNGMSAEDEARAAYQKIRRWYRRFKGKVCIGNHDERHFRLARKHGLPDRYLRGYAEVWKTPEWDWRFEHRIDGVMYTHGTGASGKWAALNLAMQRRLPTVIGHIHAWGGVNYHANSDDVIFGMNAGCGIDCRAYAFAYGKAFPTRPVLGCGIVAHGSEAHFIRMPISRGEKYHRSRANKKRVAQ